MNGLELIDRKDGKGYFWVQSYRYGNSIQSIKSKNYDTLEDAIAALFKNDIKWIDAI